MPKTILIVEDSRIDETLIRHVLKDADFTDDNIVVARDGVEALDYLFGTGKYEERGNVALPSLIILDLHLPKINGVEVLRRIRADSRTQHLLVSIFSSSLNNDDITKSDKLGVTSYIHKSPDLTEYARSIHELIKNIA